MSPFALFLTALALFTCTLSQSLEPRQVPPGNKLVRTVYQFPNETWIENLAIRSNGKILVTLISAPEVWEVDPFAEPTTAELVYSFPDAISLLGIAEYAPDVFAVNVGNFTYQTVTSEKGSWSVWSLDLREHGHSHPWPGHGGDKEECKARKITDIPAAELLNGMSSLPTNPSTLLVADSGLGVVWHVDAMTGSYEIGIDEPEMKPNTSVPLHLGVNGIRFAPDFDGYAYFTNTFKTPHFNRVPIDAEGKATGPVEVILDTVTPGGVPDDFSIDHEGNAYIADGAFNGLLKVAIAEMSTQIVVGGTDRSKIVGQTACNFGRAKRDVRRRTLYVTNTGGLAAPPPRGIEGGAVYVLDTAKL